MAKNKKKGTKALTTDVILRENSLHYMRYLRKDRGESVRDIARSEGVTQRAVEKSVRMVEMHRSLYSAQNLNVTVTSMLMGNAGNVDQTLRRMFDAKEYIERKNPDGSSELIPIDDKLVQLEAVKVYGKLLDSMQPKGSGMTVKVQQNNANQTVATTGKAGGYEDMLHSILKNVGNYNQLPSETGDVIEAEETEDDDEEDISVQA